MTILKTLNEVEQKILAAFRKPERFEHYTHDALIPYVQYTSADTCLRIACLLGQTDLAKTLVEEFSANAGQTRTISSDRHAGQLIQVSLLDDVLEAYATEAIDRESNVTNGSYAQTFKYLLQNGVSPRLNDDPLESPILLAHLLACPDKAKDQEMPHYDLAAGTYLENGGKAFAAPYIALYDTCPADMEIYFKALEVEQKKLKAQFAASGNEDGKPSDMKCVGDCLPSRKGLHLDL